jgi:hypothetical protein
VDTHWLFEAQLDPYEQQPPPNEAAHLYALELGQLRGQHDVVAVAVPLTVVDFAHWYVSAPQGLLQVDPMKQQPAERFEVELPKTIQYSLPPQQDPGKPTSKPTLC